MRPILAAAVLAIAVGLFFETLIPGGGHVVAIGAAVCGFATWTVPFLGRALFWYRDRTLPRRSPKRSSLVAVGRSILVLILVAGLSAVSLSLALLTFVFAGGADWAWLALVATAAFWLALVVSTKVGRRRPPRAADDRSA